MFDWFRCRQRGCLLFKYNSTFDIVDELWVTQVEKSYPNADTFYYIPEDFDLIDEVYGEDCGSLSYSFQKWVRT